MATDGIIVRVATPDDEHAVSELLEASYPALMRSAYEPTALSVALPAMTRANPQLLSSGTYYVSQTRSGLIAGCGGWSLERPGHGDIEAGLGHIRHFATHPDWIGRGIGRAIYAVCEREARSYGVTRLEVYSSLNAEQFYSTLGFEVIRQVDVQLGHGRVLPGVLMARSI